MWDVIYHLFLKLFGLIKNPVKQKADDVAALSEKEAIKLLPASDPASDLLEPAEPPKAVSKPLTDDAWDAPPPTPTSGLPPLPAMKTTKSSVELQRWAIVDEILDRPFDSPLEIIPTRRYKKGEQLGVYDVFGRAPKESGNKKYPKAKLKVFEALSGKWNKNKPRLYVEINMGEHLREGLARAEELEERLTDLFGEQYDVISYPYSIGSFSHRRIQNNPKKELSYHSWALAFDQNSKWNRGINYATKWLKRIKSGGKTKWVSATPATARKGPINKVLPFSLQYYECFPKSVPFEFVLAMKSCHFCWGGDWGRSLWHEVVREHGVKYDQEDPKVANSKSFKAAMNEWSSMRYYDGMHFELTMRGEWAKKLWARHQKYLEDNIRVA